MDFHRHTISHSTKCTQLATAQHHGIEEEKNSLPIQRVQSNQLRAISASRHLPWHSLLPSHSLAQQCAYLQEGGGGAAHGLEIFPVHHGLHCGSRRQLAQAGLEELAEATGGGEALGVREGRTHVCTLTHAHTHARTHTHTRTEHTCKHPQNRRMRKLSRLFL